MEIFDNSLLIMIAAIFLSKYINARAIKKLSVEKKVALSGLENGGHYKRD